MKKRLSENRKTLFKSTCFGQWLDISFISHEEHMIHYKLQKQGYEDDSNFDMPMMYYLHGRILHYGRPEFCLPDNRLSFWFGQFWII